MCQHEEIDMELICDHEKLYDLVFPHDFRDQLESYVADEGEIADSIDEIEFLNPKDAIEVIDFENEFNHTDGEQGFAVTWRIESKYYVCKVPNTVDTYLLFDIGWDDNMEDWSRESLQAASGCGSHVEASKFLLRSFAIERLPNAGSGEFADFLKKILEQKI